MNQLVSQNQALQALGGTGVNFSNYFTGTNDANLSLGNVATAQDQANYNALGQLAGNNNSGNPFQNYGTITPADFNIAGAMTDINGAIQSIQSQRSQAQNAASTSNQISEQGAKTRGEIGVV